MVDKLQPQAGQMKITMGHNTKRRLFYQVWATMKKRCYNPKHDSYKNYGGKGIKIVDEWLSFDNFYNDMFPAYEIGLYIDRIDNDKDYSKVNCRWVTVRESNLNKSNVKIIGYMGIRDALSNWARFFEMKPDTLYSRIFRKGWDIERAFFTPIRKRSDYGYD